MIWVDFIKRWWVFVWERFSPCTHGLMALALFYGNWQVARHAIGNGTAENPLPAIIITLSIFLRLRIFDDIKDYATDCGINPERPLARGLISVKEAKAVAFFLTALEGILAWREGQHVFIGWSLLLAYSLLMYREFFIGSWLRPKMELYAFSHTLIAIWIGLLVSVTATGLPVNKLPISCGVFAVCNWLVFNVFEFARKTYGANEEPAHEETYSKRLTPTGASILTLANALGAVSGGFWIAQSLVPETPCIFLFGIMAFGCILLSTLYACRPTFPQSRWFRQGMALYIILFYVVAGLCLFP